MHHKGILFTAHMELQGKLMIHDSTWGVITPIALLVWLSLYLVSPHFVGCHLKKGELSMDTNHLPAVGKTSK